MNFRHMLLALSLVELFFSILRLYGGPYKFEAGDCFKHYIMNFQVYVVCEAILVAGQRPNLCLFGTGLYAFVC